MTEVDALGPAPSRPSFLKRLSRGSVSKILLGSLVGQGTVILSSPALTRLYSPSDFAALAVVTAVSSVVGSVITLSWERAVVVPRSDAQARTIVQLGLISVAAISAVLGLVAYLAQDLLQAMFNSSVFTDFWWLIPATAATIGLYTVASSSLVRQQKYGRLALRNATVGVSQTISSITLGIFGLTPLGLISSIGVGRLAAVLGMLPWSRRHAEESSPGILRTASEYRKFPLVNTWSRLLNSLGLQLPVILIVALFGSPEAGLYALTLRVLASPVSIVSDAVSQYFEGTFALRRRQEQGGLRAIVLRLSKTLALVGAIPTVVILIFAPPLFSFVFGTEWADAGVYAQALVVGYYAQLVVSPVSRALVILGRQGTQLAWDACRLVAMTGVVIVSAALGTDFMLCALLLAAVQVVAYSALFALTVRASRRADAGN
ncbi:MAG: oligosaccharide flippase family protein [Salinibacterium sp.]|nr:oligosaccharide flippase family protein [Salinibacterium sp.]MBF0673461.1 oligosaccharide flippase family protein [Salinibacterium sp.]